MNRTPPPDSPNQQLIETFAREDEDAEREGAVGYMGRALVQCTLPHRKVEGNEFVRENGNYTLSLMAPAHIGLPYGVIPRLILCWMTTEAVKKGSRKLVLGDSLSDFMRQLDMAPADGRPSGGRHGSITRLKDQARRLFNSTLTLSYKDASGTRDVGFRITHEADLRFWGHPEQIALWGAQVMLTEEFYQEIIAHHIPLDLHVLKDLKKSPLALDAYVWLSYRMFSVKRPTKIPWTDLAHQFGSEYGRTRDFKAAFLGELKKVLEIYPRARVEESERWLTLKPSPTHLPKRGSG